MPEVIEATDMPEDGGERISRLLVSGWWGVSQHLHYGTEILLVDRQGREERRGASKCGEDWARYTTRPQRTACAAPLTPAVG